MDRERRCSLDDRLFNLGLPADANTKIVLVQPYRQPRRTGVVPLKEAAFQFKPLKGHTDTVCSVAFSPDGKRIITASWDKTARLWDADSGKQIGEITGHVDALTGAAFSPDGKRIVTASVDRSARLWDAESGRLIGTRSELQTNGPASRHPRLAQL